MHTCSAGVFGLLHCIMDTPSLCRDCLAPGHSEPRCPACRSPRVVSHNELNSLTIAHIDCDAFYASVEKRDNPELANLPVIIGGGKRGVVSTCCYIARIRGVRSAMPMFQATRLCPDAVIIKPRMSTYVAVSKQIKAMFEELTPAVEPLSLDEAFLDLTGTARLHGGPPAWQLARLQKRLERELGITVSIGLSHNKFLAKIASDLDKPRGFSIIGRAETEAFLGPKPVSIIWGVGPSAARALESQGIRTIADLRQRDRKALIRRFGSLGDRLHHLAHGLDQRSVSAHRPVKSISTETTFFEDVTDLRDLEWHLWNLCERVSARAKAKSVAGRVITLKLKRADHRSLSRRRTGDQATNMADRMFRTARTLLRCDIDKAPFRLIGVGLTDLVEALESEPESDFLDPLSGKRSGAEHAADQIRARYGDGSIIFGRSIR